MEKKILPAFDEFASQKKSLQNFGSLASPAMSPKEALSSSICDYLNSSYPNPSEMEKNGICGIVDALKIYQRRVDYLTVDFLLTVVNNHLSFDVRSNFQKSIISNLDRDLFRKMTGHRGLEGEFEYYSQAITVDRLIEIFEIQHTFVEQKRIEDFSARLVETLKKSISSTKKIAV